MLDPVTEIGEGAGGDRLRQSGVVAGPDLLAGIDGQLHAFPVGEGPTVPASLGELLVRRRQENGESRFLLGQVETWDMMKAYFGSTRPIGGDRCDAWDPRDQSPEESPIGNVVAPERVDDFGDIAQGSCGVGRAVDSATFRVGGVVAKLAKGVIHAPGRAARQEALAACPSEQRAGPDRKSGASFPSAPTASSYTPTAACNLRLGPSAAG
jgi:hypothetical protein